MSSEPVLLDEFMRALRTDLLARWYPLVIDRECGGYYTNVSSDWKLLPEQEKMIVTQARHMWTLARVSAFFNDADYQRMSRHGYMFLRNIMWDREHGGFYQIRNRRGGHSHVMGWRDEKRAYGNAFGVYALAALYDVTRDVEILDFAGKAFSWIEEHACDPVFKGYFQFLTREGVPFDTGSTYRTIASDGNEVGYKDQNSSIHLLEAYTELYKVWKDPRVREQLLSLLTLIRDTMVSEKGYLQLFFHPDWSPLSFRDAAPEVRQKNFGLDHVSFGHDYETAFLMLEASHALGLERDTKTLVVARKMLDHALANGWDAARGGFYDAGYYFSDDGQCTIVRSTKNWWAQAEGLNALLLFARIFPESDYYTFFLRQWDYVRKYVLDHERGDWFEGGLDAEPHFRTGPKSHIWKCTYHTSRALMNCIGMLWNASTIDMNEGVLNRRDELKEFVDHWRKTARGMAMAQGAELKSL